MSCYWSGSARRPRLFACNVLLFYFTRRALELLRALIFCNQRVLMSLGLSPRCFVPVRRYVTVMVTVSSLHSQYNMYFDTAIRSPRGISRHLQDTRDPQTSNRTDQYRH